MKWILVEKLARFNRWRNKKSGCCECFWPEIDPNKIVESKEERSFKYSQAQKKVKNRKKNKSIVINPHTKVRY